MNARHDAQRTQRERQRQSSHDGGPGRRPVTGPVFCVLCAPGSPWSSRRRSCIERTRVASAAPWSSYCTAWHYCCRSRPLRPPSLASGVSGHPGQASSRGGQRSCRRGSDVREDVGHCFVPRPTTQGPPLLSKKHANRVTGKFSWTRRRRVPHGQNRADVVGSRRVSPLLQRGCRPRGLSRQMHNLHARHPKGTRTPTYP
jgi:hypothetical protein